MATHSSILVWEIPWTEEPDRLQSIGSQKSWTRLSNRTTNKQICMKLNVCLRILFCCCCSVTKSCLTLCDPLDCSMPGFSVLHCLPESAQFTSIELVMLSNHLILCRPLLIYLQSFPASEFFSGELALHIRWL